MRNVVRKRRIVGQHPHGIFIDVKPIGKAFYNMFHEMKKVTWPTKKALVNYTLVVLAFMVLMGIIIGLFDLGAGALVGLITG